MWLNGPAVLQLQVRYENSVSKKTLIKFMTDGVLQKVRETLMGEYGRQPAKPPRAALATALVPRG